MRCMPITGRRRSKSHSLPQFLVISCIGGLVGSREASFCTASVVVPRIVRKGHFLHSQTSILGGVCARHTPNDTELEKGQPVSSAGPHRSSISVQSRVGKCKSSPPSQADDFCARICSWPFTERMAPSTTTRLLGVGFRDCTHPTWARKHYFYSGNLIVADAVLVLAS